MIKETVKVRLFIINEKLRELTMTSIDPYTWYYSPKFKENEKMIMKIIC